MTRIWKAIQRLETPAAPQGAHGAPKGKRSRKKATADKAATAREASKKALVIDMLKPPDGASLKDIMSATGWQAHSVRGFISGSLVKKMRLKVESTNREDGERTYRIAK